MNATAEPLRPRHIHSDQPAEVPDVAFAMGLHRMGQAEMSRTMRAMMDARPKCRFKGLQSGKRYWKKPAYSGAGDAVFLVRSITPAGKQAVIDPVGGSWHKVYAGSFDGDFYELDDTLISFVGVTHRAIVEKAVETGLDVPPAVRREYPELFVEIPERFGREDARDAVSRKTNAERVRDALNPGFARYGPVTVKTVDGWIDSANERVGALRCERTRMSVINPAVAGDYDRHIGDHFADIDFYRWLRPLVDVGGVFHLEG